MNWKKQQKPEDAIRLGFWLFNVACLFAALIMPDRGRMFDGLYRICTMSGQVTKSYFDLTYGGISGTFLNVALVGIVCALVYHLPGAKPNGVSVLAFFLTVGFAFWGITALNIWFCFPGVLLYCLVKKQKIGQQANAMLFVSGLAPLLTDMLFRYPYESWHGLQWQGILLALAVGTFIGFFLPAGLAASPEAHRGFSLYSAALPIGVTAFFLRGLLYQVLGGYLPESGGVGLEVSYWGLCNGFCLMVFSGAIVLGIGLGGSPKGYWKLLRHSGHSVDYNATFGVGNTMMNFGIYGIFIVLYYNLIGANWNAVTLGCVFCMVCCCAAGSHPRNVWPIMVGYVAASFLSKGVCALTGADFTLAINAQAIVIGLCFANGLSPVAGKYGWPFGIAFGMIHYFLVTSVPLMHGAFCLYNGGFTAAITCMLFMPVVQNFFKPIEERKKA